MTITVGSFPYAPGFNPYQRLFTAAIESAGLQVLRIPPRKWFPLQYAVQQDCHLLHLDWPYDWYHGRNLVSRLVKRRIYIAGLEQLNRKPILWTAHNLAAHDSRDRNEDYRMTQLLIDRCDGIMVMSHAARDLMENHYRLSPRVNVRVIYHGHYMDCYPNTVTRGEARAELAISAEALVFLSFGSIRPYKGHLELIRAFSRVSEPQDCLVIAGAAKSEDYVARLREEIDANASRCQGEIRLIPEEISDSKLQFFFNSADVCVLPFADVLNSGSMMLAMSFGKLVVAPRLGSIPEVAHAESYVGYDPGTPEALDESLLLAKQNLISFDQLQLLRFVRSKYAWEGIGHQLREWYLEIMSQAC